MLERFTDGSQTAMRLATGHMQRAGKGQLDTADMLVGLMEEGGAAAAVLAERGVTVPRIREQLAEGRLPGAPSGHPAAPGTPRLARDARDAVELALRHCLATSDRRVGPEHLLLGVLGVDGGAARSVLGALGVDEESLGRSAREKAAEGGDGRAPVVSGTVPADVPVLPPPPALPAGRATAVFYAALVPVHLLLGVLVVVVARAGERGAVAVALVGVPVLAYLVSLLSRPVQRARIRARVTRAGRATRLPAAALAEALRPSGIVALEVYAVDEAMLRNTAFGVGSHGFIKLARTTLRIPEVDRFVTAHEAGHVARRDTLRLTVCMVMIEGLLAGGLFSGRLAGLGVAVLASVVLWTGVKWRAELHCDTIAVRWVGLPSATAWYRFHRAVRKAGKRTPRWYLRHSVAWLHHPPLSVRRRSFTRAVRTTAPRATAGGRADSRGGGG
jgi:Zn-dependent protease with chaperone function